MPSASGLRHHDPKLHARQLPSTEAGRAAYEALEQARCEALGGLEMVGVGSNLASALDERCRRQGLDRVNEREQAPMSEMMRLLAREAMTGAAPPPTSRHAVDLWRTWFDERIGANWSALAGAMDDQEAYGREVRRLLADLDLDVALDEEPEPSEDEDDEGGRDEGDQQAVPEREGEQVSAQSEMQDSQSSDGEEAEAEPGSDRPDEQDADQLGIDEPQTPGQPWRPDPDLRNRPDMPEYRVFTAEYDEIVDAVRLCDPDELTRLRLMLDQQLKHLQGVISRLANRLQRGCWPSRRGHGSSTWRKGCSMPPAWRGSSSIPSPPCPTRWSGTPSSAIQSSPC